MPEIVKNRSEILFLYDVKDANPNGDPIDENKPRIDEETGVNIVTDTRLKRTIRDYLHDHKGLEIFIREIRKEDGNLVTKEERLNDFENESEIIEKCIDIRLFGTTTAVENKTLTLTGPVQFKFGRSLHRVDLTYIKGTTVMPSGKEKKQGTFTEKYILPYSLIVFYGVVNENAARTQNIPLTDEDIDLMLEAIWHGTKNLISSSKFGQMPRLLLHVIYKENENFHIGELDKFIKIKTDKPDEAIRDIEEIKIDITELSAVLKKHADKILKIRYKVDERVNIIKDDTPIRLQEAFESIPFEELRF
uniref:Type I-B CRISPR-associated protein Cas7/Csh2 n=1 Tax=candidate division WOR-3 bacterium TaxID=2052148 RepID=A0A7C2PKX1_UNCW3